MRATRITSVEPVLTDMMCVHKEGNKVVMEDTINRFQMGLVPKYPDVLEVGKIYTVVIKIDIVRIKGLGKAHG